MNKFQIENLDFCQSTRNGSAHIITGALGKPEVDVDASVDALVLVKGTTVVVAAAAAGAVAASLGGKSVAFVSTDISGSIF